MTMPDLENPIVALRQEHKITQFSLAHLLGVTEQTVRRAEQGTFNYLPPSFSLIGKQHGPVHLPPITHDDLSEQYEEWKIYKRRRVVEARIIPNIPTILNSTPAMESPLYVMRRMIMESAKRAGLVSDRISETSVSGFAKLVAIDPATINEAEASYSAPHDGHYYRMLLDLGYHRGDIVDLRRVK